MSSTRCDDLPEVLLLFRLRRALQAPHPKQARKSGVPRPRDVFPPGAGDPRDLRYQVDVRYVLQTVDRLQDIAGYSANRTKLSSFAPRRGPGKFSAPPRPSAHGLDVDTSATGSDAVRRCPEAMAGYRTNANAQQRCGNPCWTTRRGGTKQRRCEESKESVRGAALQRRAAKITLTRDTPVSNA